MAVTLASYTAQLAGQPLCRTRALRSSVRPQAALPRRRAASVRAAAEPEQPTGLAAQLERMMSKYDFLSAGMGAMVVTGFCVARGQDVGTALWITAAATVVAILVNEYLPGEH